MITCSWVVLLLGVWGVWGVVWVWGFVFGGVLGVVLPRVGVGGWLVVVAGTSFWFWVGSGFWLVAFWGWLVGLLDPWVPSADCSSVCCAVAGPVRCALRPPWWGPSCLGRGSVAPLTGEPGAG